jgi:hypothetical protein
MSHVFVNPSNKIVHMLRVRVAEWNQNATQKNAFVALHQYQFPVDLRPFGRKTKSGLIFSTLRGSDATKYPQAFISYLIDNHMNRRKVAARYVEVLATASKDSDDFSACIEKLKDECKEYDIFVSPYGNEEIRDAFLAAGFVPFNGIEDDTPHSKIVNKQFNYPIRATLWLKKQGA